MHSGIGWAVRMLDPPDSGKEGRISLPHLTDPLKWLVLDRMGQKDDLQNSCKILTLTFTLTSREFVPPAHPTEHLPFEMGQPWSHRCDTFGFQMQPLGMRPLNRDTAID